MTDKSDKGQSAAGIKKPTGPGREQGLDKSDPHPAEEGNPYGARHPGGSHPPKDDLGPNPAKHD